MPSSWDFSAAESTAVCKVLSTAWDMALNILAKEKKGRMGVGRIDDEERLLPPPGPESRSVAGHAACSHHAAHSQSGWIKRF